MYLGDWKAKQATKESVRKSTGHVDRQACSTEAEGQSGLRVAIMTSTTLARVGLIANRKNSDQQNIQSDIEPISEGEEVVASNEENGEIRAEVGNDQ